VALSKLPERAGAAPCGCAITRRASHAFPALLAMGLDIAIVRLLASLIEPRMGTGTDIMRTRIINILLFALLGLALAAGPTGAQVYRSTDSPGAAGRLENAISVGGKYQNYIYGVVKKIGKDQIILDKTRFGDDQVFKLEHKTSFVDNGKRSTLAQLKVGDMVWIDAKINKKTNEKTAKKVVTGVGPTTVTQ
jgi:hypothetical protein